MHCAEGGAERQLLPPLLLLRSVEGGELYGSPKEDEL
jgi:hypothetical protein